MLTLYQLLLQTTDLVVQLLATAGVQRLFALGLVRHSLEHIGWKIQRTVIHFGAQALNPQQHRQAICLGFADIGSEPRVVQANQRRAGLDDLPFLDVQLGDDTALKVLDFLDLGRWNRLAVALGHFVDDREVGPEHQEHEEANDRPNGQPHHTRRIFDQRFVHFRQRLALQRGGAFEVTADRVFETWLMRH